MAIRWFFIGCIPHYLTAKNNSRMMSVRCGIVRLTVRTFTQRKVIMSEFLYIYRWSANEPAPSPELMQQRMVKWTAWMKGLADNGHIKDRGNPLERTGKLVKGVDKTVLDGPYAETKDLIGGYTLIEAKDIAQAAELAKGCPILPGNGSVEIRPIMKM
jgi:hypothetical protein